MALCGALGLNVALLAVGLNASPRASPRAAAPVMASRRVLSSVLSFAEARAMARSMGMASEEEWTEYSCPGAYRLPLDPHVVWASEWRGWDDFLGVMLPFAEARSLARELGVRDREGYERAKAAGAETQRSDAGAWGGGHALRTRRGPGDPDVERLPARPDLYYRAEWTGWGDFLASGDVDAADASARYHARERELMGERECFGDARTPEGGEDRACDAWFYGEGPHQGQAGKGKGDVNASKISELLAAGKATVVRRREMDERRQNL